MELPPVFKKIFMMVVYAIALTAFALYLFFPKEFVAIRGVIYGSFLHEKTSQDVGRDTLRIGFVQAPDVLEPTSLDPTVRTLALHVYEPLVRMDAFLNVEPALAHSWGRVSPTVWEFRLRPEVVLHTNRYLTVSDVVASFQRAAEYESSDLKGLLKGVSVIPKDDIRFEIQTEKPDALLLQKLTTVLILPQENARKMSFAPNGTGPYLFGGAKRGESFSFSRFDSYWGEKPAYQHVDMLFYPKREDRVKAIQSGDVDIAVSVPPEDLKRVQDSGARIQVLPSLEVNFLTFHVGGVFRFKGLRDAVSYALDSGVFVEFAKGYATPVHQFVSSGVFGFHPKIPARVYDLKRAKDIVQKFSGLELIPIKLLFVEGLETAGTYVQNQLRDIGFDPTVQYVPWSDFREQLMKHDSDLYFYGWKSDLGSVNDFLVNAVHSSDAVSGYGSFNAGGYGNPQIDTLIEQSSETFDASKRLAIYQDIMQRIVVKDPYGVPLFESQVLYASSPNVRFVPRIDGYVLAQEIK